MMLPQEHARARGDAQAGALVGGSCLLREGEPVAFLVTGNQSILFFLALTQRFFAAVLCVC